MPAHAAAPAADVESRLATWLDLHLLTKPERWSWDGLQTLADAGFWDTMTSSSRREWETYFLQLGPATNLVRKGPARLSQVYIEDGTWVWEARQSLISSHVKANTEVNLTWREHRSSWRLIDLRFIQALAKRNESDAGEPPEQTTAELEAKVRDMMGSGYIQARRDVGAIYRLVDRLIAENRGPEAIPMLQFALKVDAGQVTYRLTLAELLLARGEREPALEQGATVARLAEARETLERLARLDPRWEMPTATNAWWNAGDQPLDGARVTLVVLSTSGCYAVHHDLARELNRQFGVPVRLVEQPIPPGLPERDGEARWMNRVYSSVTGNLTSAQAALLGLDFDFTLAADPDPDRQFAVIEAAFRLHPEAGEQAVERLREARAAFARKSQYDAQRLIQDLRKVRMAEPGELVIAITELDLFMGKANYVFSSSASPFAIFSTARFTGAFWDKHENRPLFQRRMRNSASWSIMSAAARPACTSPFCAYAYMHSLDELDEREGDICETCRKHWDAFVEEREAKP